MVVVDNINWPEILKDRIVTAERGNDNKRIAVATEILQQTAHQFAKVLNERASLLANGAQFEAALRDAAAIRTMLPESGLGYLCTGDVYCQQGRYAAAIAIFDQGLEAVPESDPYHQQLQQHRSTAVTSNSKHIDFISQLPLDIVITNILPRALPKFFTEASCELLYVSPAWQERILKQPKGLRFEFDFEKDTFKHGHDQIVKFAPYVQRLGGTMVDGVHLDDLFSRASFSKLKRLDLNCGESSIPRLPWINGLRMIADSLTHLEMWDCPCIQLRDILESCPHLTSLMTYEVDLVMPTLPSSRFLRMTHLELHGISASTHTYDNMIDFLSRFPSLLSLEITPMPDSSLLTVLHKHCPHLQVLYYGTNHDDFMDKLDMDIHQNQKGIKLARLNEDGPCIQDDLIHFLHLHQHSLETFSFGNIVRNDNPLWELSSGQVVSNGQHVASLRPEEDPAQAETSFNRLISIDFSVDGPPSSEAFIIWLISKAPNLKIITCPESRFQPCITNAMTNLQHLSMLAICRAGGNRNFQGIIQFLEYHIAMGHQSTLEKLDIRFGNRMSKATWLPLISKLTCLKYLELFASIPEECIPTMAEIGQGCPALEELSLEMWGGELANGVMESLRPLSNLKCLQVKGKSLSSSDLVILTTFPSLQKLNVRCDNQVPDYIVQLLYKHIPKVMIE